MSRDFNNVSALDFGDVGALKIAGTTLTVACWIYPDTITSRNSFFSYSAWDTNSGLKGWSWGNNFASPNSQFHFSKLGVVDIFVGGAVFTTGAWQFAAAAMTSGSNVFYRMAVDGTLTTASSNNAQSFSYGSSIHHGLVGARSSGNSGGITGEFDGRICEIAVWDVKLTQDELVAYAYGGPWRCGVKPVFYSPLWGAALPEPELSGLAVSASQIGTVVAANHGPVGCPFPVAA